MLLHDVDQVVQSLVAVKHLPLPILHITLQVESRRFVDAEILQSLGNGVAHFLSHPEKMVDGIAAGEDDGSVFRKFDMFLTKLACRDIIELDELLESEVHTVFLHHVGKGCLRNVGRLGL